MTVLCQRCGAVNPAGGKFCQQCGNALAAPAPPGPPVLGAPVAAGDMPPVFACPRCGAGNPLGAGRCFNCGAALRRGPNVVLIVVVCVLGALLLFGLFFGAIVFPVFTRARAAAWKAVCHKNMAGLAMAMLTYAEDNNQRLPLEGSYLHALTPYRSNEALWHCPADKEPPPSYSLVPELYGKSLGELAQRDREILLYEGRQGTAELRHLGGANAAFADGHVKAMSPPPTLAAPPGPGALVPLSTFQEWARAAPAPAPEGG